jgi:hypothetical protein
LTIVAGFNIDSAIMAELKSGLDRILNESNAALRELLARLEAERERLTAPLDERISLIRSMLQVGERPSLEFPVRLPAESRTIAKRDRKDDGLPRGQAQRRAYKFLQTHPNAGYRELAVGTSGKYDTSSYATIRNTVLKMKKGGWVTGTPGEWILGKGGRSASARSAPVSPEPSPKPIRRPSDQVQPPVSLRKSSGEASAGRKLQGQYLGVLRGLRPRARAQVQKVAREQGVAAAVKLAMSLK